MRQDCVLKLALLLSSLWIAVVGTTSHDVVSTTQVLTDVSPQDISAILDAIDVSPQDTNLRCEVSEAMMDIDRVSAEMQLTEALRLDPSCICAHDLMARLLRRIGSNEAVGRAKKHEAVSSAFGRLPSSAVFAAVSPQHISKNVCTWWTTTASAANVSLSCDFGMHVVSVRLATGTAAKSDVCSDQAIGTGLESDAALVTVVADQTECVSDIRQCLGQRHCAVDVSSLSACHVAKADQSAAVRYRCKGFAAEEMQTMLAPLQNLQNFYLWESHGIHVTPVHFYSSMPEVATLPKALFEERSQMVGVQWNADEQLKLLHECSRFHDELRHIPVEAMQSPHQYHYSNRYFEWYDGALYHCMIRLKRPKRIVEVGAGWSTMLSAAAVAQNNAEGASCHLTAIDPYPAEQLYTLPGLHQLYAQQVQHVDTRVFQQLQAGDILFIDGSHVLHLASDVRYLLLEVLPRLASGVVVHIHDIFLPYHYPQRWLQTNMYMWNEQYALHALLAHSTRWQVVLAAHWLQQEHSDVLARAIGFHAPQQHLAASFWLKSV
eukprot:TRINITY_DN6455_c0_g1_i1.p2 TRINITY_DN6455_c0_g1~~TRINITY_DN6455_c0_g1_i1.p2  ORF type:complete len:547 (-),score=94.56 TRINITY_DN6455_c0_g1_i1:1765-3405(-)